MPNTDEHGNKIATKKETKTVISRQVRERRITKAGNATLRSNKKHCGECGFRIRNEGHSKGGHHNGNVPPCHRGR